MRVDARSGDGSKLPVVWIKNACGRSEERSLSVLCLCDGRGQVGEGVMTTLERVSEQIEDCRTFELRARVRVL